jgi:hypothetical protein
MDDIYRVIKGECQKLGLDATRVDENVGAGLVMKEVTELIEKAAFIICDLTHGRPNVYFELGYALGVGNNETNVLLIAREKTRPHFDVGLLRVHLYASTKKLRAVLARNLKGMKDAKAPVVVAAIARTGEEQNQRALDVLKRVADEPRLGGPVAEE